MRVRLPADVDGDVWAYAYLPYEDEEPRWSGASPATCLPATRWGRLDSPELRLLLSVEERREREDWKYLGTNKAWRELRAMCIDGKGI
jgi:hypothetical protein